MGKLSSTYYTLCTWSLNLIPFICAGIKTCSSGSSVADCPYENREDHGGRLILKDALKSPSKKTFKKKNIPNRKSPSRMVLVTREEYMSGDKEDEEEPQVEWPL